MRSLIAGIAVWGIGCVIPAPLEAEPEEPQSRPVITKGTPDFGFTNRPLDDVWSLGVTAVDDNLEDVLLARLIARDGETYKRITQQDLQLVANRDKLSVRSGTFKEGFYCAFPFVSRPEGGVVYACVTDGTFTNNPAAGPFDEKLSTGRVNCNYWVVKCVPRV